MSPRGLLANAGLVRRTVLLIALTLLSLAPATSQELVPAPASARYVGDLSGMAERGVVRLGTTLSRMNYFLDDGRPRGATLEAAEQFEEVLRDRGGEFRDLRVLLVPMARDQLFDALLDGRVDLLAASLSITPERAERVAFSTPVATDVRELVVTGPSAPRLASIEDLAGQTVHVRASSSYAESLEALNESFGRRGLAPLNIEAVDELLETEDVLELVAAGVYPMTIADSSLTGLWSELLPALEVRDDLVLRDGVEIAWAMRPDNPEMKAFVDAFVAERRRGTLLGNILINRYYRDNEWVRNPLAEGKRERFDEVSGYFRTYADRYGMDWLLSAAQGYQESKFDQSLISPAGAVGIMQILPTTAADSLVGIPDIRSEENNIHAGIKYKAALLDRYFSDPAIAPVNRRLFALAAYNAGPRRVREYRSEAAARGLDPNRWFRNVELVSNPETRTYVANIFKYYVTYQAYVRRAEALAADPPD